MIRAGCMCAVLAVLAMGCGDRDASRASTAPETRKPDCSAEYRKPPTRLTPVDVQRVQKLLWTEVQTLDCKVSGDDDTVDMSFDRGEVGHGVDCNTESGRWGADRRRIRVPHAITTLVGCAPERPYGTLGRVHTWGMAGGDLYLLDARGRIEFVVRPARTQDAETRCRHAYGEYPEDNVREQCRQAAERGWLERSGSPTRCLTYRNTDPVTIGIHDPIVGPNVCTGPPVDPDERGTFTSTTDEP